MQLSRCGSLHAGLHHYLHAPSLYTRGDVFICTPHLFESMTVALLAYAGRRRYLHAMSFYTHGDVVVCTLRLLTRRVMSVWRATSLDMQGVVRIICMPHLFTRKAMSLSAHQVFICRTMSLLASPIF